MRDYGKVYSRFWTQPDIRALSNHGKLLAAYLLTCSHTTLIGCFRLPLMYVCADLNWQSEAVTRALSELHAADWLTHDAAHEWVCISKFLKYNPIENPNQGKAAVKLVKDVPRDSAVWSALVGALNTHGGEFVKGLLKGFETVSQPLPNPQPRVVKPSGNKEQKQEQKQEQEKPKACTAASAAPQPPVMVLPLVNGTEYGITKEQIDEWRKLYPAVDVPQAVRNMRGWLDANKSNRKTQKGVLKFVHGWLRKEQDRAPRVGAVPDAAVGMQRPVEPERPPVPSVALPEGLDANTGREAWDAVRGMVKPEINSHSFDTWFKPTRGVGVSKGTLFVRVPTAEFEGIGQRYADPIERALSVVGLSAVTFFHEA